MTPERYQQINRLLDAALEREPDRRDVFLAEACGGDDELRREVKSLLAACAEAGSFIEGSPDQIATELMDEREAEPMTGRILGRYKLGVMLGAGGMGEVYRATDTRLRREVAVKILPPHLARNTEALHRFEREARAVAALSHANILAIYDFGTEEGVCFAVTELLEGETLRARLSRSALNWREAVEIGAAIADGLAGAHAKGIIHRDLKPENVFLTNDGVVKILDFGIARVKHVVVDDSETLTSPETTRPGTIMGTIGYMSPEQVRGEEADAPSDLFSLGCVLYEMVGGQRPFAHSTAAETIAAILKEEPSALATTGRKIPNGLEQLIRACLEKQPSARLQSARDLAQELNAIADGRETQKILLVQTRPSSRLAVRIVAAAFVLLLAIALTLYLTVWREQPIDSLAVLPLVNASGDANLEYLSDGITEALTNSLSQLPQLKRVIAQSTMTSYKGKPTDPRNVGQELNVCAVLTWRMTQQNDTLIIGAELVNVADGSQLWGERYNLNLSDLLTLHEEIARHVSENLRLKLSGEDLQRLAKRQTTNIEAHKLYLKGHYYLYRVNEGGLMKALEYFKQAIDLDPNYALAYAGMANAYVYLADDYLSSKEAIPMARAAAQKALGLDETLAEAHDALALVKFQYDWEWIEAERAFRRALELNPGYASAHNLYGFFLVMMRRFAEAQREMDRARELDPLSPYMHVGTVWPVLFARQYNQAIEQLRRIVALNPDFANAHLNLGWAYEYNGMYEEAITALRKARSVNDWPVILASLGYAYTKAGQREEAQKVLTELQEQAGRGQGSQYYLAVVYAGLGEKDQALAALERASQMRDTNMIYLKVDPFFDSLRADPRFTDLLRKINLAP